MNKTKRVKLYIKNSLKGSNDTTVSEVQEQVKQEVKTVIQVDDVVVTVTLPQEPVNQPPAKVDPVVETEPVVEKKKLGKPIKKPVVEVEPVVVTLPESTNTVKEEIVKEEVV